MSSTYTRRAPSGHVVTVEWEDKRLSSEVTGVRFAGSRYGRAFQIGTRGFHDDACRQMLHATAGTAIRVGRHEVRLATSDDRGTSIATLVGDYHELMTVFSGPAPSHGTIAGLFSVLDLADTPEGLVVRPNDATLLTAMTENVMLVTESLDSLDMLGPAHVRPNLPRGRGARTRRGGEVWRRRLPGRRTAQPRDFSYTLGFPAALGDVMPGPVTGDDADLAAWLDAIHIQWHRD